MARIAIVTIHGMGETRLSYADKIFQEIKQKMGPENASKVETGIIYYQDILQENQERYFKSVKRRLNWDRLRKFVLYGFSDAASLESLKEGDDSPYYEAQLRVLETLRSTFQSLNDPSAKLVVIAQSLGGQVMSNYLWDASRSGPSEYGVWSKTQAFASLEEEAFCRGNSLIRFYTTGCNIPIFVAGHNKIVPIPRPNVEFEWHNYYDKDDVLGWPLAPLSDAYKMLVKDHKINSGGIASLTPLSHVHYWDDKDFLRPLIRDLKKLVR